LQASAGPQIAVPNHVQEKEAMLSGNARLQRELNDAATERYQLQALVQQRQQSEAQVRAVLVR